MRETETKIAALIGSVVRGMRPRGSIRADAGEGTVGYTGTIECGLISRKQIDMHEVLKHAKVGGKDFGGLLFELREASKSQPLGPWYRCNVEIKTRGAVEFRYFWEGTPFNSIAELEPTIDGHVPHFVFARRFDRALVAELSDFDLNSCLFFYVPTRVAQGKDITDPLMEVFGTVEWQSDVNNGAMDQYFARATEPMTGLARFPLYAKTYAGLRRMGLTELTALYVESIALYAHFHERVEAARQQLGIAAVPRQERSDIMSRYYSLTDTLDKTRASYIRARIAELEQH